MNFLREQVFGCAVIILLFGLVSCSSMPPNLGLVKKEVLEYYESGKIDKELEEVIEKAAKKFQSVDVKNNSAVVFDIDETALSNYEINKQLDFGYIPELWDEWILEEKATAIKPVKRLYDSLKERGVKLIFISGRKDYHYQSTYNNLIAEGYSSFDTLITRQPHEYQIKAQEFKSSKRAELVEKGYDIIGSVGDQFSDLEGPYSGIKIKIPNYIYYID